MQEKEKTFRGVQLHEVCSAADALLVEGLKPTIERVRQKLGRGSPNTVAPMLDAWFSRLGGRLQGLSEITGTASGTQETAVPPVLIEMAASLWTEALRQSTESVEQAHQEIRSALVQQQGNLEAAQADIERERMKLHERQAAMDQLMQLTQAHAEALARQLTEAHAILHQKEDAIASLTDRLQALDRERELVQRQHDEAATLWAQERRQLEARAAASERRLLNEVDLARQEAKGLKTHLANSLQQKEDALKQAQALIAAAIARQHEAEAAVSASFARQDAAEVRMAELQSRLEQEKGASRTLQKQLVSALEALQPSRGGRIMRLRKLQRP